MVTEMGQEAMIMGEIKGTNGGIESVSTAACKAQEAGYLAQGHTESAEPGSNTLAKPRPFCPTRPPAPSCTESFMGFRLQKTR